MTRDFLKWTGFLSGPGPGGKVLPLEIRGPYRIVLTKTKRPPEPSVVEKIGTLNPVPETRRPIVELETYPTSDSSRYTPQSGRIPYLGVPSGPHLLGRTDWHKTRILACNSLPIATGVEVSSPVVCESHTLGAPETGTYD